MVDDERTKRTMKKKTKFVVEPFDDIRIIGINTGMLDYQLAWNINKAAKYDEAVFDGTDAAAADSPANLTSSTLGKGDILLYTTDAAGNVSKIVRLFKGSDIKAMLETATPKITDVDGDTDADMDDIALGSISVAGTPYNFYLGYLAEVKSSRISLVDGADANATDFENRTALTLKGDSVITDVDFFYAENKVTVEGGDFSSFDYDTGVAINDANKDGDIVFVRAINETIIKDAITFESKN